MKNDIKHIRAFLSERKKQKLYRSVKVTETPQAQQLEEALADFTGRDRAMLFSNGYMANMGVISDAGLLSNAKMRRYKHNDINHLKRLYESASGSLSTNDNNEPKNSMIATDGVFSMDGDVAPISALAKIAKDRKAWLMVDDAHGFGVLGKQGAGLLQQQNLSQTDVPVLMATLGKACGTSGAFVAGSEELIEYLTQTARTFIYTTAMPSSIASATLTSLKLINEETWRREKLRELIQRFKQGAEQLGIKLMASDTAIQPIMIGSTEKAVMVSESLQERGILVSAIRPPTVPEGTSRLRVTFSANHTLDQVDILLESLETLKL